ncbi:hypothetical protein [Streptomyces sp. MS2.AVA.5]|uniref:Uncharacterized protein n=1 Tax=Streptomyces achmelvichensis TaxID=3134111 RepID=A0ACC6PL28_9ACTN
MDQQRLQRPSRSPTVLPPLPPRHAGSLAWALDHPTNAGNAIWASTTRNRRAQLRRERTTTAAQRQPK